MVMSFWSTLFSLGRQSRLPVRRRGNAGRFLPPANVRRTQLGIKDLDLDFGAIQLVTGQWACSARVLNGWPAHIKGQQETMAYLRKLAAALNKLPSTVVMMARVRSGGLEAYAAERRVRAGQLALTDPLRRLLVDQANHANRRMIENTVRTTDNLLVARGDTPAIAMERLRATLRLFKSAKIEGTVLTKQELAASITEAWQPKRVEHFVEDFYGPSGEILCSLVYSPGAARVTTPEFVEEHAHDPIPALPVPSRKRARVTSTRTPALQAPHVRRKGAVTATA